MNHQMMNKMKICPKCTIEYGKIYEIEFYDVFECPKCNVQKLFKIEECCRKPFKIVVIDRTKKVDRLLFQCKNCGGIINRNLPLSYKKYSNEIRDEINEFRFYEWLENLNKDYLRVKENIDENNFRNSKRGKYFTYLGSEEWRKKRKLVLERDKFKCQKCNIKIADEVHHLTYERLYNEKLEDLISVCSACHKSIHKPIS